MKTEKVLSDIPDNPYILLTPGPLSTSAAVRNAMLRDWCTWDEDYNIGVVQDIRTRLTEYATSQPEKYTAVLMQGSGSFGVEACLGTAVPEDGKLLIIANGAYGRRMVSFMQTMGRSYVLAEFSETEQPDIDKVNEILDKDKEISHVAMVFCETTTGILNPVREICLLAKEKEKMTIVDAMSAFGGIPMDMEGWGIDYLISSSNKCIQGVPGFSFIIASVQKLALCEGNAHSHSLDVYDQWKTMDKKGKWRFTSPTHTERAFQQALNELDKEGGIEKRYSRYSENQQRLREGMKEIGYETLLDEGMQSPIITAFCYPDSSFEFKDFYEKMKEKGFVLYPGKVSDAETFRIGNIGEVYLADGAGHPANPAAWPAVRAD